MKHFQLFCFDNHGRTKPMIQKCVEWLMAEHQEFTLKFSGGVTVQCYVDVEPEQFTYLQDNINRIYEREGGQ